MFNTRASSANFPTRPTWSNSARTIWAAPRRATLTAGAPDAELQQMQTAYDELKLKWTLADSEVATVANLSKQAQVTYFCTVKPDSVLAGLLEDIIQSR